MRRMLIAGLAVLAGGCASTQEAAENTVAEVRSELGDQPTATAQLRNAQGQVVGTVTLEQEEDGVDLEGHLTGLPPGLHGFHIHQTGRCTAPDFTSAGGHYNPTNMQHGFEDPEGPHAGDMQNLTVQADGSVHIDMENQRVTITDGPATLFDADGSALVIHSGPDDYRTDPSGNSGSRIACGVITR